MTQSGHKHFIVVNGVLSTPLVTFGLQRVNREKQSIGNILHLLQNPEHFLDVVMMFLHVLQRVGRGRVLKFAASYI